MKTIINKLLAFSVVLCLAGCSFLNDNVPQATLSEEEVRDPKQIDNMVISAYAIFISAEDINSSFSMWNFDVRSDDAYKGGNGESDGDVFHQLEKGATVTPAVGVACDFTEPVDFTVTCRTASYTYKVTVKEMVPPHVIYLGLAATMQQLNMEEQTACTWMLNNVEKSAYVSFADFAAGQVNMSNCKVIWWHFHKDGGINDKGQFETNAADAMPAVDKLKAFYNNGGSFLLTRYATYLPAYLGEADCVPNNCWGQNEDNAETINNPWEFSIAGHTDHAIWQNLLMNPENPNSVYTCDKGYRITNSTAQYHIGADWGGYATKADFCTKTGAVDIAGGNDAVVAWEYPSNGTHGRIICIGSGCYDWYTVAEGVAEYYHVNVAKITDNAINYLSK